MDSIARQYLIIGAAVFAAVCLFMHILGLAMQTVTRFPDAKLERMGGDKRAAAIAALQERSELTRFKVILVQIFCGAFCAAAEWILLGNFVKRECYEFYRNLSGGLYSDSIQMVTAVTAALPIALMMILYGALVTELPRRAAKTGSLSGENGERFALRTVGFLRLMLGVFAPVTFLGRGFLALLSKPFGVQPEIIDETGEDLIQLIDAQSEDGGIEEEQAEMISNIFEFGDLELHEVMTHRTEVCAAEISSSVGDVVKLAVDTGFSRIPVYRETVDDICGVIYVKDLLPLVLQSDCSDIPASKYMHKIKYVPESGSCGELFTYFTENNRQIAVVLDEYGGTAGVVTMEDLLERIVGNIRDEYDEDEDEEIEEITPHTYDISGSADPDEAMERLGSPLPEDHDYDTMGGFVTDLLGFIPEEGQTPAVRYGNITFGVISARDNRIVKLRAVIDKERKETDNGES